MQASNMKQAAQPYMTYPHESQSDSRMKNNIGRNRMPSKPSLNNDGDIPVLPLLQH